jgi:replicative DNA helicase
MIARLSEANEPLDLVIVDYVNIVSLSDMDKGLRHDQQIGMVAARLRHLAKTRNCAVVLLCQLNRNSVSRDQKAPELSDLKDSSALEQAADTVLFAHRPEYFLQREYDRVVAANETPDTDLQSDLAAARNKLFIICAKQRMGPTGQRELGANVAYNYLTEGPNQ